MTALSTVRIPVLVAGSLLLSATLSAQSTTWTSFHDRRGHAMASTPAGGIVMFGGERVSQPGQRLSDTHQLSTNNQSWSRTANGPGDRSRHGLVGVMVGGSPKYFVFGGLTGAGQPTATTWQYDGSSWDMRGLGTQNPTARSGHGMVAGQLGGANGSNARVWMFGGFNGTSEMNDFWNYQPDVDQWNRVGPAAGQPVGTWPAARSGHALAFVPGINPGDERVYVFGGRTGAGGYSNDLWRYNPTTSAWQQLTPPTTPPARRETAMAYVPGQGGIVMFGGLSSAGVLADTWVFDPSVASWSVRNPASSPPGRYGHAVSVDGTGDKLVMLGGELAPNQPAAGAWIWDSLPPGNWVEQFPVPSSRTAASMAYNSNPNRQRHVLFGGVSTSTGVALDDTWELSGIDWTRRNVAARPSARSDAGMVYNAARDRVLLYGGRSQAGATLGDAWEWNGSVWSIPALTGAPPVAAGIQPVFDTARNRVLMPVAGATEMETWTLTGSAWTQLSLPPQPSARTNYGAAYDTRRDLVVMFGGMSSNSRASAVYNNETWIFDGSAWVRRFTADAPSPRGWCRLAYDESRSRVVLYGGADATNVFEETWEFDGSNWYQESPAQTPGNVNASYGHATTYDAKRALTVTHGQLGTWDYGPVAPADVTLYGAGCQTSANQILRFKQLGWTRLWLGERMEVDIEGQPAFSLGLMLWGLSDTVFGAGIPLPLDLRLIGFSTGPCYLSTSADITTEAIFPGTTRYVSFPMPTDPYLLGLQLYLQLAYFDAPANPSNPPVVTSNALKMKLGQKATLRTPPFEPNPALGMVRVGAGTFSMGSVAVGGASTPVRPVTITRPFWIGRHELTQALYQAVVGNNPSFHQGASYPGAGQRPVEQVSWDAAMAYCALLNAQETAAGRVPAGYQYRLPSEAEWEYACRAGATYEWSTGTSLSASQANVSATLPPPANAQTVAVGAYAPSAFGLYDMHGNVREWCLDAWDGLAGYTSSPANDPYVNVGPSRVHRGGAWSNDAAASRSAARGGSLPVATSSSVGFRLVLGPILVPPPPPPVASFTATPTSGFAPLTVQFTDTSTNGPTSWQWDFQNDGVVDSTQQNPSFVYATPGVYPVRLVVSSLWGSSAIVLTPGIQAQQPPPPVASFSVTPTSGIVPLQVQFTDTSTNAPTSWQWDFQNDGVVDSTQQNPSFTYATVGVYPVRLVVANAWGSNSYVLSPGIDARPVPPPVASFSATPRGGQAPLVVQFTDTSTGGPTSWQWDFQNDGVVDSTQQNPSFTYTANGSYSVRLVATNANGSGSVTMSNYIGIGVQPNAALNMVPIAPGTFMMGSVNGSANEQPVHQVTLTQPFWMGKYEVTQAQYSAVRFANPSTFRGASYPSAAQQPVETVTWADANSYCVALTNTERAAGRVPAGYHYRLPTEAEWEYCCRAGTATEYVFGNVLICGQANFWPEPSSPCVSAPVVVGSYPANAWGIHDMHGNVNEWCLDAISNGVAYSGWALVDPFVVSGSLKAMRGGSYLNNPIYCRSASRSGFNPASADSRIGFRVVLAPMLYPGQTPVASFSAPVRAGVGPLVVQFTDASANSPTSWQWDFDDNGTIDSTQQNPTWTYTQVGNYGVRLIATNQWGSSTLAETRYISVTSFQPPVSLDMVAVASGDFLMGSTVQGSAAPIHRVSLMNPFWIGRTELTIAQYAAVMGTAPNPFSFPADYPVGLTWQDAQFYCMALTASESAAGRVPTGYQFRLPTEAEWEYCCRAGTTTLYYWGDRSPTCADARWFGCGPGSVVAVGGFPGNPWGLHDMSGNAWEWCLDAWDGSANYPSGSVVDPYVGVGSQRITRGGSAANLEDWLRSGSRDRQVPNAVMGLRVVLAPIIVP